MNQVNVIEKLLIDDGMHIVKFWFSIKEKQLQKQRLLKRISSPLEQWKVSQVDLLAQEKWEEFTEYKKALFQRTHLPENPWVIVQSSHREESRIGAMRYLLSKMEYEDKSPDLIAPDPDSVFEYRPY